MILIHNVIINFTEFFLINNYIIEIESITKVFSKYYMFYSTKNIHI